MADHNFHPVKSLEVLRDDLFRAWQRLNVEQYGGMLPEPEIKFRRMKLSDGFYKHVPQATIVINERVASTDWPATLAALAHCVAQQAQAARGHKPISPRQLRRLQTRQAETTNPPTTKATDVVLTVKLTRAQINELARASQAAKGAPITVQFVATAKPDDTQKPTTNRAKRHKRA